MSGEPVTGDAPGRADTWEQVVAAGSPVPTNRPLAEMTVELVAELGSPDPARREGVAVPLLRTWLARGVYDDLLPGLGDGLCEGLRRGLGEDGTLSVLRRVGSARILRAVLERDRAARVLHPERVLKWGDAALSWYVRERDLRGWVAGAGPALAVTHGAHLLRSLAGSPHLGPDGPAVVLQTIAERLVRPTDHRFVDGEDDQLAVATLAVFAEKVEEPRLIGPWLEVLRTSWREQISGRRPAPLANTVAYLRALHVRLALGQEPTMAARPVRERLGRQIADALADQLSVEPWRES